MEFLTYARVLLRRWAVLVILALLAAGSAYAYSIRAPRLYRATSQLSVTPSVIEFFTGEAVQRLLNNYTLQLKSRSFASQIGEHMRPPESGDQVAGKVRAVAAPSDYRISIEVDDADPARAQGIANAAALAFVEKIHADIAGKERHDIDVQVLDQADLPGAPVSPRPKRDAAGAGLLGLLIGAGVAFLLEFWDDTLKSRDEIEAFLGLPVLGAIPTSESSRRRSPLDRVLGRPGHPPGVPATRRATALLGDKLHPHR